MSERGRRLYDWWSRHPGAFRLLYGVVFLGQERQRRRASLDRLGVTPGDRVVEVGCGRGNTLAALSETVGPDGSVIGIDYSSGMTRTARDRTKTAGLSNVTVIAGDAHRLPLATDSVDAAYAAMSLTAMPDATRVTRETRRVLRPGGRLSILDARPFQHGAWRLLNPLVVPVSTWLTDWHPKTDPVAALRAAFDDVTVDADTGGAILVATGE